MFVVKCRPGITYIAADFPDLGFRSYLEAAVQGYEALSDVLRLHGLTLSSGVLVSLARRKRPNVSIVFYVKDVRGLHCSSFVACDARLVLSLRDRLWFSVNYIRNWCRVHTSFLVVTGGTCKTSLLCKHS